LQSRNDISAVIGCFQFEYYEFISNFLLSNTLLQYLSVEGSGSAYTHVAAKLIGFTSQTTAIEGKHDYVCVWMYIMLHWW